MCVCVCVLVDVFCDACRELAKTTTVSMLTDVQAVKGRFHWGDSTAWRMPGGGAQVRAHYILASAVQWLHTCTSAILL